jgi:poly(A) polymerase
MEPDQPFDVTLEAPVILDRGRHPISRRNIDPDALKVLYRLSNHGFTAYLVGGAVRDLLLDRRPADFDIGTNARPNQIKKLFRNAFLIGRRFRLAHIKFHGGKTIEVSTFRRKPDPEELEAEREEIERRARAEAEAAAAAEAGELVPSPPPIECAEEPADLPEESPEFPGDDTAADAPEPGEPDEPGRPADDPPGHDDEAPPGRRRSGRPPLKPIAFGTPREDAFRRDLTINALFYDIATFSVIDYVGGLQDLEARRIRIIGDPDESYAEDPVRIWRVLRHAARLGFSIEERTAAAIPRHRERLSACPGSRLFEELNKDIKTGNARAFFEAARAHGILPLVLGGFGAFYERDAEAFSRLLALLGAHDAAVFAGAPPPLDVAYALLLQPWADPLLAALEGDKVKPLYDLFRDTKPAALVPKILLYDAVQTLAIVDVMIHALETGKMRWSLRKRPHYPGASQLASLLVAGTFGEGADPFAALYGRKFGAAPRPPSSGAAGRPDAPGTPCSPGAPDDDRGESGANGDRSSSRRRRRRRRKKPKTPAPPSDRSA